MVTAVQLNGVAGAGIGIFVVLQLGDDDFSLFGSDGVGFEYAPRTVRDFFIHGFADDLGNEKVF